MNKKWLLAGLSGIILFSACGKDAIQTSQQTTSQSSQEVKLQEVAEKGVKEPGEWITLSGSRKVFKGKGEFFDCFDTVISVTYYTKSVEEFQKLFDLTHKEYLRLHQLYDNYHGYDGVTNVFSVNQKAGQGAVPVSEELFSLLKLSKDNYDKVKGKVNIAMGSVLRLWHDAREANGYYVNGEEAEAKNSGKNTAEKGVLPTKEQLEEANRHCKISDMILNDKDRSVELKDSKMSLDLGAVAKGYATERIAQTMKKEGLESGLINAGGNVKVIGLPADGRKEWSIGVQNPKPEKEQMTWAIKVYKDQAVVTSGDYQRYFMVNGKKYHHIIDPKTLYPETRFPSVSVVTEDSGLADFLSTAMFLSDKTEAEEIRKNFSDRAIGLVWIDVKNELSNTENLQDRIVRP